MLLSLAHLTKRFEPDGPPVVNDVSFEVAEGEIFALLGPSGCGKTTTLRCIAGFERADAGVITLAGRTLYSPTVAVPPEARGIGFVFQDYALFPHLSVLNNVTFGLQALPRKARAARAKDVLELVGLYRFQDRMPAALSGGQQQRVALARAIAPQPRMILLDEPFSSLDALLRQATRDEVRTLLKKAGMTALLVTHDQEEALSFADRIGVMREGRIEQIGSPEALYDRPETLFVAQFLGRTNLLFSQAAGRQAETPLGPVTLNRAAEGQILVALRPEHITLEATAIDATCRPCTVIGRDFKGHDITYRVEVDGHEVLVHTDNRRRFSTGDAAFVRVLEPGVVLKKHV